ncbi:ArsR/SmtB family transcription factor [Consotaella aegiceratis]|uniref:ArsR/SmtB family transcription factor n=1 Tax=Consotaella aegiceratis TaxID=3097961 RepID=UPI002F40036B
MDKQTLAMDREAQIRALSSPVRMTILRLLADPDANFPDQWSADPGTEGVCMSLIARAIDVKPPTASRHIDILRQAGFLTVTRIGKWGHCTRNEDAIREYLAWVAANLELLESRRRD